MGESVRMRRPRAPGASNPQLSAGFVTMPTLNTCRAAFLSVCTGLILSTLHAPVLAQQDVLGAMGGQQVRSADVKRLIDALSPDARKRLGSDLGALDRLIREELVRQTILTEARQQGWDKKPDVQLLM